ncbi:MAG: hypothetical protein PHP57_13645 [Sideroxydans sp.]|nr:hypothetical protein [Sideroxydans sp.]
MLFALCSFPALAADALWPWASQSPKKAAPVVPPYQVPTFSGKRDFRSPLAAWVVAPRIDGDAVFRAIVSCFPSKSTWNMDVNLQTALRTSNAVDISGTAIGKYHVGIVANMPLYSSVEIDRERQREYQRRIEVAKAVAEFIGQIANRNTAVRALSMAAALEARAQVRVNEGIVDADEQIKFLDRVIKSENDLVTAEAKAMDARLSLVASCREEEAERINEYLTGLAQLPETAKP